jgi:hypothetical protein
MKVTGEEQVMSTCLPMTRPAKELFKPDAPAGLTLVEINPNAAAIVPRAEHLHRANGTSPRASRRGSQFISIGSAPEMLRLCEYRSRRITQFALDRPGSHYRAFNQIKGQHVAAALKSGEPIAGRDYRVYTLK